MLLYLNSTWSYIFFEQFSYNHSWSRCDSRLRVEVVSPRLEEHPAVYLNLSRCVKFKTLGLQICIACERLWREFSEGAHLPDALTLALVMGATTYKRCFCLILCISWQNVFHVMKLRRAVAPFTQQFFRFLVATAGWCCCGYLCMRECLKYSASKSSNKKFQYLQKLYYMLRKVECDEAWSNNNENPRR